MLMGLLSFIIKISSSLNSSQQSRNPMTKKILIVEDNIVHPSLNLEASNYQVIEASTANDGLNKALELKPQLILMDMDLPDSSGFDLCKKMRAFYELKKVPIII